MKRKIVAMIMASTLAFSLVACGSSTSSSEEVVEETNTEETAEETTDETEEATTEDTTDETSEEVTEDTTEEEVVEEAAQPDWVETIYTAFQESDLDTIYEIIEAEDFIAQLNVYDVSYGVESVDCYTVDDENTLAVYSYEGTITDDDGNVEDYTLQIMVGVISTADITKETTSDDVFLMLRGMEDGFYAETLYDIFLGEEETIRYGLLGTMYYINYGFEDEYVADLADYGD